MKRLHIIGGKNHGKTTLVVELVTEFTRRGMQVGTVKHTHHRHELDVPGKDSFRHRSAGAAAVGILSPSMTAIFLPDSTNDSGDVDRYSIFARIYAVPIRPDRRRFGSTGPKIEVWRSELGTPPLAMRDPLIRAVVTDDKLPFAAEVLPRSDVAGLSKWIINEILD